MDHRSIYELTEAIIAGRADKIAYRHKLDGTWTDVTWRECGEVIRRVGKALLALEVKHGDRVSILCQTRLAWVQIDYGIVNVGGVTVGIYPSNLARDCGYIINHSDSEVILVENAEQLDK